jgi:hypothetical protein
MLLQEYFPELKEDDSGSELTREEKKELAKESIRVFFTGKECWYGGHIPEYVLLAPKNIDLVVDTEIESAVPQIYEAMGPDSESDKKRTQRKGHIPPSTESVLHHLNQCGKLYIPKMFAGGILLIYYRLCEGLKIE